MYLKCRARILHLKRKKGKRRGMGSHKGKKGARISRKRIWITKIRAQRNKLRELRSTHTITISSYRKLYGVAKSGAFRSVSDMENYIDSNNLRRRR
jgi:large subunit ribosomal protein L19e